MRFIFVRHGHYDKKGKLQPEKNKTGLNARGREAARAAGEFLKREGIVPEVVFTTRTERTRETARIVLATLGVEDVQPQARGGGFSKGKDKAGLDAKLAGWIGKTDPDVVMFVGHHPSQNYCVSELSGTPDVPDGNKACVLVYDKQPDGWLLTRHHLGLA